MTQMSRKPKALIEPMTDAEVLALFTARASGKVVKINVDRLTAWAKLNPTKFYRICGCLAEFGIC